MPRISLSRSRRVNVTKVLSRGHELDTDIADALSVPAAREGDLLDVIRKAGGDESVEKAAAAYARLTEAIRESFGEDGIPVDLLKAMTDQAAPESVPEPVAKSEPKPVAKAEPAKPIDTRTTVEKWEDVARIERQTADAMAEETLATVVKSLRRRNPTLTEAQAVAKALDKDPSLYESMLREQRRESGHLDDSHTAITKAREAERPLAAAIAAIRKADPTISETQATKKALDADPTLYTKEDS